MLLKVYHQLTNDGGLQSYNMTTHLELHRNGSVRIVVSHHSPSSSFISLLSSKSTGNFLYTFTSAFTFIKNWTSYSCLAITGGFVGMLINL